MGVRYIFITGGVCSSLGKGVAAASIGALLEARKFVVRIIKIDPYINVDAGTMNPYQHGEVYVTDDGAETDLDLGNYARFTSSLINRHNSITTGQVYREVIEEERAGKYLGKTVQMIPHITDRIKDKIQVINADQEIDIAIIEIGGTVGDIESIPFIETARQMIHEQGRDNIISVHVTLLPHVSNGEIKTKPTQHSVKELREIGIQPDILICRSPEILSDALGEKIALFTNVSFDAVISAPDVRHTIYEIPLIFHRQQLDQKIIEKLHLPNTATDLGRWDKIVSLCSEHTQAVRIAMVGKYVEHSDSYHSVEEALLHGAMANNARLDLMRMDSEQLTDDRDFDEVFGDIDGILVPGGFGKRGIAGILRAIAYARQNDIPYFGICMGMQLMAVEFAHNVLGESDAHSAEFAPDCKKPVVALMDDQLRIAESGGTMRLGIQEAQIVSPRLKKIYHSHNGKIRERHRHRYEIVNDWLPQFEQNGLELGAQYQNGLVEALIWKEHPWGIGVQYHPEFTSKPLAPNPLFADFVSAASARNGEAVARGATAATTAVNAERAISAHDGVAGAMAQTAGDVTERAMADVATHGAAERAMAEGVAR